MNPLFRLAAAGAFALALVAPAPAERSRGPGFTPKDLTWMLLHAPSELVILRPDPAG